MASAGVRRMVLASTSGTIGVSRREEILDEQAPYAEEIVAGWPYYASKIYQEFCTSFARTGFPPISFVGHPTASR